MDEAGTTDWNVFLGWRELAQHCGMRECELSQRLVDLTWCIVSIRFCIDFCIVFLCVRCDRLDSRQAFPLGMEEKGQCMWLHDLGWFLRLETCFDDCFSASLCSQTADGWPLGNFWNICHGFTCTRCTTVHTHTYEQFHSVALRGLTTFIVLVSCCFIRMQNMSVPSCWTQLHASMWMHSNLKHQQWNFNFNHEVTCWWWHSYRHPSHLWSRTNCNWRTLTLHTYFAMSQYHDYTISIIGIYAHCITLHTVQVQLSMATNWSSQT